MIEERTTERAAAKPFKILSAYFMTAATTIPPRAFRGREGREGERKKKGEGKGGRVSPLGSGTCSS